MSDPDADVRALLARAVPDVTPDPDARDDVRRGRAALGRRRSVLATLGVGLGTALVVSAVVTVPQRLDRLPVADGTPAATGSAVPSAPQDATDDPEQPVGTLAVVALEPPTQEQRAADVVATALPHGWTVVHADDETLIATDGGADVVEVVPSPFPGTPPVMRGVGDFERLGGTHVTYYFVDESSGSARPTMVFELTYGRWAQVSVPPRLGWGMHELGAFASGLRAPYTCPEPCEVPLTP